MTESMERICYECDRTYSPSGCEYCLKADGTCNNKIPLDLWLAKRRYQELMLCRSYVPHIRDYMTAEKLELVIKDLGGELPTEWID